MSLVDKLEERLSGGKFRLLNEKLYSEKSLTKREAESYHKYYESQVKKWPKDPRQVLSAIVGAENAAGKIADIGCGSAFFAKTFQDVASYDKYPMGPKVIEAELESIPAPDHTFDAAIHCLSLMTSYIGRVAVETNRILAQDGMWYILEVRSRIINLKTFINNIEKLSFKLHKLDTDNTHFIIFVFKKTGDYHKEKRLPEIKLRPCIYKKR